MRLSLLLLSSLLAVACGSTGTPTTGRGGVVRGTPPTLRVAAEWEPALGVLVRWPAYLPHRLLVELSRDTTLFVSVEDAAARADAERWFAEWGIDNERVRFLEVPGADDAQWTRDYGPHPLFGADGELRLVDGRYDRTTPDSELACDSPLKTPWNGGWGDRFKDYDVVADDAAPTALARALGLEAVASPLVLTGGNVLTDGRGGAFSTCVLVNENGLNGYDEARLREEAQRTLGLERWTILPNFEDDGIQHVDCFMKLLDGERLLVARPPRDHALFERYERIVNEHLATLVAPSGRPYDIRRIDLGRVRPEGSEELAAYTNALVLNGRVYVPFFGIPEDQVAMDAWLAALPGHEIVGFRFELKDEPALPARAQRMYPGGWGWRSFDALHCRTRAVWDPDMLHVAVNLVPDGAGSNDGHAVVASIVPYGADGLVADALAVRWRLSDDEPWSRVPLARNSDGRFEARIEGPRAGDTVEYFVEARDTDGRVERAPRMAPADAYSFRVTR